MKENLASLSDFGRPIEARIRDAMPTDVLEWIDAATRVNWFPVQTDIALTEAVARCAGAEGLARWSADTMRRSFEGPMLKPIVDGAIRIFGLSPAGMLKFAPTAWAHIYRNCGALEYKVLRPGAVELHNTGAAAQVVHSEAYLTGVTASIGAVLDVCRAKGEGTYRREAEDHLVFRFDWRSGP